MNTTNVFEYLENPNQWSDLGSNNQQQQQAYMYNQEQSSNYYAQNQEYTPGYYYGSYPSNWGQHYSNQQVPINPIIENEHFKTGQRRPKMGKKDCLKKIKHNNVERKRRDKIRDATLKIKDVLPGCILKASIGEVLEATLDYVKVTRMTSIITKMLFGHQLMQLEVDYWLACDEIVFDQAISYVDHVFSKIQFQFGYTTEIIRAERNQLLGRVEEFDNVVLNQDSHGKKRRFKNQEPQLDFRRYSKRNKY
ncbi:hypothetical protein ACOME3_004145 [Neoechinorhynchus agilis]